MNITEDTTELIGFVAFEGKLRAGHDVGAQSLLVSEKGQFFRADL